MCWVDGVVCLCVCIYFSYERNWKDEDDRNCYDRLQLERERERDGMDDKDGEWNGNLLHRHWGLWLFHH